MHDLERSSEEIIMNTQTSQAWIGTKALQQLIQGKPFWQTCALKLKHGAKTELKCVSLKYEKIFPI